MNLNKRIAKTMVFALALGMLPFSGVTQVKAAVAKPEADKVTLVPATETITIGNGETNAKFWGVAKKLKSEKGANITVGTDYYSVTDVFPVLEKTIDLSSFNKKEVIIAVGPTDTPNNEHWLVKTIDAANKNFNVEYFLKFENAKKISSPSDATTFGNEAVGYLGFSSQKDKTDGDLATNHAKIEVKEGDGAWKGFEAFFGAASDEGVAKKLTTYLNTGKVLKFRMKEEGKMMSNESVVKIPALSNAPNVKFDPFKGTTGLKKNMEYKVKIGNGDEGEYQSVEDKVDFTTLDVYGTNGLGIKGGKITVRTKATNKKPASKESVYTFEKQDALNVVAADGTKQEVTLIAGTGLKAELKVKYNIKKGAILTNGTDNDYEYFLSWGGADPVANSKWLKLKAQKTSKGKKVPTKVTLKYSAEEKANTFGGSETKIYLRLAGKKQEGNVVTLASKPVGEKFVFKNIEQEMTAASTDPKLTPADVNTSTLTVEKAKAGSHKLTFSITNVQNPKSNLKVKVLERVKGVSVKTSKLKKGTANSTADVTISVSKSAFPEANTTGETLKFKVSVEGVEKEHTMTIKTNQ